MNTLDVSPLAPPCSSPSFPWCSDCVAERCDVLVKCRFSYFFFFVVLPSPFSPFLGNEVLALMQQEAVWRREAFLGEETALLFPAEVQTGKGLRWLSHLGTCSLSPPLSPKPGCSQGNGLLEMFYHSLEDKS